MLRSRPMPPPAAQPFVLLVDDHEPSLSLLQELVEWAGYRCLASRSGRDALSRCRARRPGAVITDLAMPGLDGVALARRLRSQHPGVPVVLVTAHDLEDPAILAEPTLFAEVFRKPIDPDRLMPVLAGLMGPSEGGYGSAPSLDRGD